MADNYQTLEALCLDMYDLIIDNQLVRFEDLVSWLEPIKAETSIKNAALTRGYKLIKKMHWGVFYCLNSRDFPTLWKELVVSHPKFKTAGDIKRSMTISNIFIGMLDIHGYTAFCRQSKKNLSKLHELDDFLNTTINDVAHGNGCVGNRERGDEILLVGGSAIDILQATFEIIQIFAKENFFKGRVNVDPSGEFNKILPVFNISAGISGGNLNTPMIITRKGEISGFLLNMAARLQARANKLAPKTTKVIIAKTVLSVMEKEKRESKLADFTNVLGFFDCGSIQFKGMSIANLEILYREEEKYKLSFQAIFLKLLTSLKQNLWKDQIFMELVQLISSGLQHMPYFTITANMPEYKTLSVNNDSLQGKLTVLQNLFSLQDDYISAIERLEEILLILKQVPNFEPIIIEYTSEICERYKMVVSTFQPAIENEININIKNVLSEQEAKVYKYFTANRGILQKLVEKSRQSSHLTQKRQLWNSHIEKNKSSLDFSLYSGKK